MPATANTAALAFRLTTTKAVEDHPAPCPANNVTLLTRGLRAGDERAYRDFHDRYFDRLYQFLVAVARGREDEAQEA
ncbi:MAG TPA: hypothetical protein VJA21_06165, partial [Verrucomicrobiae bacterium]